MSWTSLGMLFGFRGIAVGFRELGVGRGGFGALFGELGEETERELFFGIFA